MVCVKSKYGEKYVCSPPKRERETSLSKINIFFSLSVVSTSTVMPPRGRRASSSRTRRATQKSRNKRHSKARQSTAAATAAKLRRLAERTDATCSRFAIGQRVSGCWQAAATLVMSRLFFAHVKHSQTRTFLMLSNANMCPSIPASLFELYVRLYVVVWHCAAGPKTLTNSDDVELQCLQNQEGVLAQVEKLRQRVGGSPAEFFVALCWTSDVQMSMHSLVLFDTQESETLDSLVVQLPSTSVNLVESSIVLKKLLKAKRRHCFQLKLASAKTGKATSLYNFFDVQNCFDKTFSGLDFLRGLQEFYRIHGGRVCAIILGLIHVQTGIGHAVAVFPCSDNYVMCDSVYAGCAYPFEAVHDRYDMYDVNQVVVVVT